MDFRMSIFRIYVKSVALYKIKYTSLSMESTIQTCITNVIVSDDNVRNELKPFRRRLRDTCTASRTHIVELLQTDISEWPTLQKHNTFRTIHIEEPEEDLYEIYEKNKHLFTVYLDTMNIMFEAYERLESKVESLTELEQEFFALSCLDDESELAKELTSMIDKYIQNKYDSCGIAEDYRTFYTSHKKWRKYRTVILAGHSNTEIGMNICNICTSEKISAVLNPCGHTFCLSCASKQKKHCFVCRADVLGMLKIFF